ncbi:MAG: hypothetical protein ACR2O6_09185 [Ilumatobacteraceae bacterium]
MNGPLIPAERSFGAGSVSTGRAGDRLYRVRYMSRPGVVVDGRALAAEVVY